VAGAGRVGSSLARWAVAAGAELVGIASRHPGRAAWPDGPPLVELDDLATGGQDLLLIAVGDPAVREVAARIARRPQARIALHTSGSLDASALAPLREAGSRTGSLHPLKAFPRPLPDPAEAKGIFFAVDGDPEARELAFRLAAAWGAVAAEVPAEAAGSLGLPEEVTRGYLELARGALAGAARALDEGRPLGAAITGPAARGDQATLERHFEALRTLAPEKLALAEALAQETQRQMRIAETKKN
jgi:predicted short-subunit dehydrogenase-like oxidoreductase (DUF2520 family)